MMVSCGVDIVSNARVKAIYDRYGKKFLNKIFPEGIEYCFKNRKGELHGCIAARIALKEAVIKAASSAGIELRFGDVVVSGGGKRLSVLVRRLDDRRYKLSYSISHETEFSVAFVILETVEEAVRE